MLSDMTLQYIQIQIPLNAYVFKYKYVGKYSKYIFQIFFIITMIQVKDNQIMEPDISFMVIPSL